MKFLLISLITLSAFSHNLVFNNHILFDHRMQVDGTIMGGLSGIRYDEKTKKLLAISDDRARKSPARFYSFNVTEGKEGIELTVDKATILKTGKGTDYRKGSIDFEDIEILDSENLIITSEGNLMSRYIQPPRVVIFNKSGAYNKDLMVDNKFKPVRDNGHFVSGIRDNLSFEPLSLTPKKDYLFTGTEDALVQDGPVASTKEFSKVRFIRYQRTNNGFMPNEEYVYPLGPVSPIDSAIESVAAQSGVPAFLALDKNNLLVMERTYYPVTYRTIVRLYKVKITSKTTNVQNLPSLKGKKITTLKKELIVDFDEFLPKFSNEYKHIDNFEGMCLGPKLKNGNQTLIVVADDNFNKGQRNQFVVFEIKGKL